MSYLSSPIYRTSPSLCSPQNSTIQLQIAQAANAILCAPDSTTEGVVVTHGTDTLEETAFFRASPLYYHSDNQSTSPSIAVSPSSWSVPCDLQPRTRPMVLPTCCKL